MFTQRAFDRRRFLGTAALSVAAPWIGTRDSVLRLITVERFRIPNASDLASLGRATAWLNSAPLTADGLRGKVVLVDFWTYTCINWLPRSRHRSVAQSVGLQDWSCYARLKHFKRSVVYADDRPLLRWLLAQLLSPSIVADPHGVPWMQRTSESQTHVRPVQERKHRHRVKATTTHRRPATPLRSPESTVMLPPGREPSRAEWTSSHRP